MATVNTDVWCLEKLLRVNPKHSHQGENFFFFLLYQYEMMDVSGT